MSQNKGPTNSLLRAIERRAERFRTLVSAQIRAIEEEARERAHLATRGDRPFVGCTFDRPMFRVRQARVQAAADPQQARGPSSRPVDTA